MQRSIGLVRNVVKDRPLLSGSCAALVLVVAIVLARPILLLRADEILANRDALKALADGQPVAAALAFWIAHFAAMGSPLPLGGVMTLLAGFLFGRTEGFCLVMSAGPLSALAVALVARRFLAAPLESRAGSTLHTATHRIRQHGFSYLLLCRLVPVLPSFVVSAAAGAVGIGARPFFLATWLGKLPGAIVYLSVGQELGALGSARQGLSPALAFSLAGLVLLAILPIVARRYWNPAGPVEAGRARITPP